MRSATAFAPATVSNVGCGFDVLGFALEEPGDEVTARLAVSGVEIADIVGDGGRLPRDSSRNTASVAAASLLTALGERRGVSLTIKKGLPLSSGLGGSAASAAAAVVAVNALMGGRATMETLMACALDGESRGAGSAHADNIAPSICGGLVLVRVPSPPDVLRLPVPKGLTAVVVHPPLEIETARARALLGDSVLLRDAVRQWANVGALVDGLHRSDFSIIGRALEDAIAEPRRASLIPGLEAVKRAAVSAGALGAGLSGSGPSLFALCASPETAAGVADAMTREVRSVIGNPRTWISSVDSAGARVVSTCDS